MTTTLQNGFFFPTGSEKKIVILSAKAYSSSGKFYYDIDYQIKFKDNQETDDLSEDISFCLLIEEINDLLK